MKNVPGAWYDLGAHMGAARAVANCAADYLPDAGGATQNNIDQVAYLLDSVKYLLDMAQADADKLEQQLKSA
ncbi:MAG: hypothetical protein PHD37_17735 [Gallionellaceae bacterium]|nr:hypothetical protein [Gallionellaceae bacterium]